MYTFKELLAFVAAIFLIPFAPFIFPSWKRVLRKTFHARNTRREAKKIVRACLQGESIRRLYPSLPDEQIVRLLGLVTTLEELKQVCSILKSLSEMGDGSTISQLLQASTTLRGLEKVHSVALKLSKCLDKEAWSTARSLSQIVPCVKKAVEISDEYNDFHVTYTYSPPEPYTYTYVETISYGGTGVNSYPWPEEREVEEIRYRPAKVNIQISPPTS